MKESSNDHPRGTATPLHPFPKHGFFIRWKNSAEEIEELFYSSNTSRHTHEHTHSMGSLKLFFGNDIIIARGLKVLASKSSAKPGTLLELFKNELHLSTTTHDIVLFNLYSMKGSTITMTPLSNEYRLGKGQRLKNPNTKFVEKYVQKVSDVEMYEPFWIHAIKNSIPGPAPLSVMVNNPEEMPVKRVGVQKIETEILTSFQTRCEMTSEGEKEFNYQPVLTCILIVLYRLNNYKTLTVLFSNPELTLFVKGFEEFFSSTLPLMVDFTPSMTFLEAMRHVIESLRQLREHKTYAKDIPLRYSEFPVKSESSLLTIVLVKNLRDFRHSFSASAFTLVLNELGTEFAIYSRPMAFSKDAQRFISMMPDHIVSIMKSCVSNPAIPLHQMSMLSPAERHTILVDSNTTAVQWTEADEPLPYFFEKQCLRTPHNIALVSGNASLTYEELNAKANQISEFLMDRKVVPDTIIALCTKRSLDMVIGILGILKAGAAYLPLDPNYPAERLSYMVADSQCALLLTDGMTSLPKMKVENVVINTILNSSELNQQGELNQQEEKHPRINRRIPTIAPSNLAYVLYTSGTTGHPKGVAVMHRSLVNHMLWMIPTFNFTENDVFLQKTPYSFDASVWEFFAPLLSGGKLIIPEEDNLDFVGLIKKYQVTVLQVVPSLLKELLKDVEFCSCDSLQKVFSGGEALFSETVKSFLSKMKAELHNLYGPTEATIQMATYRYLPDTALSEAVIIGKPISNAQVYVLDRYLNAVPVGVKGELYIGGACLSRGYLNHEALNQTFFIPNPYKETYPKLCSVLYKTGDAVRWLPDGNLEYLGRLDGQCKLRGFRIELGEIESNLLQHESIEDCAVVVRESKDNYENLTDDKCLVAYYVKKLELTQADTEYFVHHWEKLFQSEYVSLNIEHYKYNTVRGISSYVKGSPDQGDMLEWVAAIVQRIQPFKPKVILDIGSGAGTILFNMINDIDACYATDVCKKFIDYIDAVTKRFDFSNKVSSVTCAATDIPYESFVKKYDTVIMNSVLQYFPNLEYLEEVIAKSITHMQPTGQIFVGDIRDYRLLKCFHCSVQTYMRKHVTRAEIDYFSSRDKELLISPEYFLYLKTKFPDIAYVEILPQLGKAVHEMNNYRYDVILHIRKDKKVMDYFGIEDSRFVNVLDIERYIIDHKEKECVFVKYPNMRIAKDYLEYKRLYNNDLGMNEDSLDKFLNISQIILFANKRNFKVKFFLDVYDPFYLNIIVFKNHLSEGNDFFVKYENEQFKIKSLMTLANNPLATTKRLENDLTDEFKEFLRSKLPGYMIPSRYVPLVKLPLNNHGKIDKRALAEGEVVRSEHYEPPQNDLEHQLCQVWAKVLGLPEDIIGRQDDFFNLGGHSLSALRTLSLIKNAFLIKLPTRTLFDYSTIEKLAQLINDTRQNPSVSVDHSLLISSVISLRETGFKAPLFLIHPVGGTIFCYKALSRYVDNRPVYAIQDPGIDANDLLFKNIQEMATFYVNAIQNIQPTGPYSIAGASFGATASMEIANQLLKAGERVNFIGLLDGWPVYSKKFWEKEFFEQLMLQQFRRIDPSIDIDDMQFLLKLQRHRMLMLRYYKIPLIKSTLTFFKAEELWPVFKEMGYPSNCWQNFSTEPVDTHLVTGNHETMFWEPHVQLLAAKLNHSLAKMEQKQKDSIISDHSLLAMQY